MINNLHQKTCNKAEENLWTNTFPCKKTEVIHIALLNKELKEENKHSKKG